MTDQPRSTKEDLTPCDTRMMGIVHHAIRRDLERAIEVLAASPPPSGARRIAIGRHITWLMTFLHQHHHGEDEGIWPLVREREPHAAHLLDEMESDHQRVAPLIDRCNETAEGYSSGTTDDERSRLHAALRELAGALLPHLDREVAELMPIVSVNISAKELAAIDKEYYVGPKSMTELGFEGHWLLDRLDADRVGVVTHTVPPIPRFVLIHGFARRYRRYATACWGEAPEDAYRPAPALRRGIPPTGRVEAVVGASPEAVWEVVADVTRVPEWSRECRRVEWLDGATRPAPGVRFRGSNKAGPWSWSRINEVIAAEPNERLTWRTISTPLYPDSSRWTITLEPAGPGTRIVQTYETLRAPKVLAFVYSLLVPSHRDRSSELTDDLRRIGEVAEAAPAATTPEAQTADTA